MIASFGDGFPRGILKLYHHSMIEGQVLRTVCGTAPGTLSFADSQCWVSAPGSGLITPEPPPTISIIWNDLPLPSSACVAASRRAVR